MPRHQANNYFAVRNEFNTITDPTALERSRNFLGEAGTFHITVLPRSDDMPVECPFNVQLWYHDERIVGGTLIASSRAVKLASNYNISSFVLDETGVLTITQANGNVVTENISLIDTKVVNFTIQGNSLFITDNKGDVFPVDLTSLGFVTNLTLADTDLVVTFADGSQSFIDLTPVDTDTVDGVINSFILNTGNNIATISTTVGTSYPVDFSSLNETLIDNANGTFTFNDGEGNTVDIPTSWITQITNPSGTILEFEQQNRPNVQFDIGPLLPSPTTDTNNYVTSHNISAGVLTSQRQGLADVSANIPLNWELAASGTINVGDFIVGWPDRPTAGTPLPAGHTSGNDYYIDTGVTGTAWHGRDNFFRAEIDHSGSVTGASGGGAWAYETEIIHVTWWWGPQRVYLRWSFIDLSGGQTPTINSFDWSLWRMLEGLDP